MNAPGGQSEGLGWIVLTKTFGSWQDDWDGKVHRERAAGEAALGSALEAGEEAILVALLPVVASTVSLARDLRAAVRSAQLMDVWKSGEPA
jgi:hypothetical protein